MLTRAFVLCSDEKALDAVSHVLSELEITFEQFHDIAFAAKRLTVQAFDLIVIDCDQQDDAARLLDSVRSSDLNRGAMTVAVVDGKAGVPIAFRLGAELVIPKPVSLEQARSTLRTAVAMYRKTHPEAKPPLRPTPVVVPQPVNPSKPKATIAFPEPKISAPKPQPASLAPPLSSPKKVELPTNPASNTDVSVPAMRGLSLSMPSASVKNTDSTLEMNSELSPKPAAEKPGYPLPAEAFEDKSRKRTVSSGLVAALVLAMIAIAGYEAYTMVPQFRTRVDANYQLLRSQIPGAKPPVAAVVPKPVRRAVKPAPVVPPDGFVASVETVEPTAAAATTTGTARPLILATTATTTTVEEPTPITVPDNLADQHVSSRVDAVYPESLRRKGVHGDVVLQALIGKDGLVDSVSVVSGNPQLAAAALDAVKQWKYQTYIHNGAPASFQTNVTVAFEPAPKSAH